MFNSKNIHPNSTYVKPQMKFVEFSFDDIITESTCTGPISCELHCRKESQDLNQYNDTMAPDYSIDIYSLDNN